MSGSFVQTRCVGVLKAMAGTGPNTALALCELPAGAQFERGYVDGEDVVLEYTIGGGPVCSLAVALPDGGFRQISDLTPDTTIRIDLTGVAQ